MLSHAIAFAFHRTAFKERLEVVADALKVVEKLREYKPKKKGHHAKKSSGMRTPIFGFSLTPFSEKDKFDFGSRPSSVAGSVDLERDDGAQADIEDMETSKKRGKRKSVRPQSVAIAATSEEPSPHQYPPPANNLNTPPDGSGTTTPLHSREDSDDATAMVSKTAKALKNAMLHDARNVKGTAEGDNALVWDVGN